MNVIFHVDDSSRWELTLGNVNNMLAHGQATGLAVAIEILANGPAVRDLAQGGPLAGAVQGLPAAVRVCACRNALRKFSLPEDGARRAGRARRRRRAGSAPGRRVCLHQALTSDEKSRQMPGGFLYARYRWTEQRLR